MSTDPHERGPHADPASGPDIDTSPWWHDPAAGYFGDDEPVTPEDLGTFIVVQDGAARADDRGAQSAAGDGPDREDGDNADEYDEDELPEDDSLFFLTVDDPLVDGYVRPEPPLGLSEQATARRLMAQQLAEALADPPYRTEGGGHDWADAAMQVPVSYPPVRRMLDEVEQVAESAILVPGETLVATAYEGGRSGMVFRVHGPAWSLVFTTRGPITAVYVCSDDITEVPLKVKLDARGMTEASVMMAKVLHQLTRISLGGDKASFNPNLARQG